MGAVRSGFQGGFKLFFGVRSARAVEPDIEPLPLLEGKVDVLDAEAHAAKALLLDVPAEHEASVRESSPHLIVNPGEHGLDPLFAVEDLGVTRIGNALEDNGKHFASRYKVTHESLTLLLGPDASSLVAGAQVHVVVSEHPWEVLKVAVDLAAEWCRVVKVSKTYLAHDPITIEQSEDQTLFSKLDRSLVPRYLNTRA